MTYKLTNEIRCDVRREVLAQRFIPMLAELTASRATLSVALWEHAMGGPEVVAKMEALPSGWLDTTDRINLYVPTDTGYHNRTLTMYFNGRISLPQDQYPGVVFRPASEAKSNRRILRDAPKYLNLEELREEAPELSKRLAANLQEELDLCEQIRTAKDALSVMWSFTTSKKLAEHWPNIIPILEKFAPEVKSLPALNTEKLDALLGLGPK